MISLVLAPNKKTLELCYWNMGQVEGKKVALNHMIPNLVVPFVTLICIWSIFVIDLFVVLRGL